MLRRSVAHAAVIGVLILWPALPASANGPVTCDPFGGNCYVEVARPGRPGVPAAGVPSPSERPNGSGRDCVAPITHVAVPCYNASLGSYSNAIGCYVRLADPQPVMTDPVWQGHTTGAIFDTTCLGGGGSGGGYVWLAAPPPGVSAAGPTPTELAAQAVDELPLHGPEIGMAPKPGSMGLVGLPVWLWTAVTPSTWGPVSATAAVPGLSVTATANAESIVWSMDDGGSVRCTKPGTPYRRSYGNVMSPDCGYRYTRSSAGQPGDAYTVTATTTWRITWSGGGESGVLTQQRSSTLPVRIGELQVLVS